MYVTGLGLSITNKGKFTALPIRLNKVIAQKYSCGIPTASTSSPLKKLRKVPAKVRNRKAKNPIYNKLNGR